MITASQQLDLKKAQRTELDRALKGRRSPVHGAVRAKVSYLLKDQAQGELDLP